MEVEEGSCSRRFLYGEEVTLFLSLKFVLVLCMGFAYVLSGRPSN